MEYSREYCESQIRQSPLFMLDREKDKSAYKREALRMVEYLYRYLMAINRDRYEPYGCEITIVAQRCIGGYEEDKGDFLHYFNSAWKREYSHICGRECCEEKFSGIHITEGEKRSVRQFLRCKRNCREDLTDRECCKRVAEVMQVPLDEVLEIAQLSATEVRSNYICYGDGEEYDLFDRIADSGSVGERLQSMEAVREIFDRVDTVYRHAQKRQQPLLSELLTSRFADILSEEPEDICRYSFICKPILEVYRQSGELPTQKDLAIKFNRKEASVSRSVKDFMEKIKESIDNELE